MRALGRVVRNGLFAIRALARIGRGRRRSRHKTINLFDKYENCRGYDHEIEAHVQKRAVSYDRCSRLFGCRECFVFNARQIDIKIGEIYFAEQKSERRHKNIRRERRHYFAESCAYYHPCGQIYEISTGEEFFPFI